jgi:hypothetical protein
MTLDLAPRSTSVENEGRYHCLLWTKKCRLKDDRKRGVAGASGVVACGSGPTAGAKGVVPGAIGVVLGAKGVTAGASGTAPGANGDTAPASGVVAGPRGPTAGAKGVVAGAIGVTAGASGVVACAGGRKKGRVRRCLTEWAPACSAIKRKKAAGNDTKRVCVKRVCVALDPV